MLACVFSKHFCIFRDILETLMMWTGISGAVDFSDLDTEMIFFFFFQEDRPGHPEYPEKDGHMMDVLNPPIVFYLKMFWPFAPGSALRVLQ